MTPLIQPRYIAGYYEDRVGINDLTRVDKDQLLNSEIKEKSDNGAVIMLFI